METIKTLVCISSLVYLVPVCIAVLGILIGTLIELVGDAFNDYPEALKKKVDKLLDKSTNFLFYYIIISFLIICGILLTALIIIGIISLFKPDIFLK